MVASPVVTVWASALATATVPRLAAVAMAATIAVMFLSLMELSFLSWNRPVCWPNGPRAVTYGTREILLL